MMTFSYYYILVILMVTMIQNTGAQQYDSNEAQTGSTEELYKMMFLSFVGACGTILLFFIVKCILECRNRNRPDPGPFGTSRIINISELTQRQRQAILEVLFTDDTYLPNIGKKNTKDHSIKGEECIKDNSTNNTGCKLTGDAVTNTPKPPPLPNLSGTDACDKNQDRLSLKPLNIPSLKRRPIFKLVRQNSEPDNIVESHDEEHGLYVDDYSNIRSNPQLEDTSPRSTVNDFENVIPNNVNISIEDEIQEGGICPICLETYDDGEIIIGSKHCSHEFHMACIHEWLEKNFGCPCCRIDMVTPDELANAISTIISKHGGGGKQRIVHVHSNVVEDLTPPPSPVSGAASTDTVHGNAY